MVHECGGRLFPELLASRARSVFLRRAAVSIGCLLSVGLLAVCAHVRGRGSPEERKAGGFSGVATAVAGKPAPNPARDTDGDGVPDERERALGSDPEKRDTDGDGFDDGFEDLFSEFGFDLLQPSRDADHDGLEDTFERKIGTNPENPDSDGDGWSDFDEWLNRFYGYDPLVPTADADFDGLADALELRIGSSPDSPDTNGDGIDDFQAYTAGLNPAGPRIEGGLADIVGRTYSDRMRKALGDIRAGKPFPEDLAAELPYAAVTQRLVASGRIKPSAALMQRSAYNPRHSPGIYPSYNQIVNDLFTVASQFNGSSGPDIVRLFQWSQPTVDCCEPKEGREKPGRTIYAMKISDNVGKNEKEPEVLFMGTHHARELITATFTMELIRALTKGYAAGDPAIRKLVDESEIWIMPVVNPNGYERALAAQLDWRKNARKVTPVQKNFGVDLNRNYAFGHATTLTVAQRTALDANAQSSNGITPSGGFDVDSYQYPGTGSFTEVETQAVRGLAHNQFLTEPRDQVDGLICALSWHTYSGTVGHPMGHKPVPPATGLIPADRSTLGGLSGAIAAGDAYNNIFDKFEDQKIANGDPINGYPVFGDSNDWLYKDGNTFAILVEGYSAAEGMVNFSFYPTSAADRDAVTAHNLKGAMELIRRCGR